MKPCIRGLKEFKKGCPENSSCPAWIETLGSLSPKVIRQCADVAAVHLLWDLNCNVVGTQQATETFRNGMCEVVIDNQGREIVRPKINQVVINAPNLKEIPNGPGKQKLLLDD